MAVFSIKTFGGISPKVPARYLQDNQAQVAINSPVFSGSLQPLQDVGASILTLPKTDIPQTIYRYGQNVDSDGLYWFHWPTNVDVCRGQIAGDSAEWTFYTGDGIPKATYSAIATTGSNYPAASIPLGLPAPINKLDATPDVTFDPTADYPAELFLDPTALANLTEDGIEISLDGGANYFEIDLTGLPDTDRATFVSDAINAATAPYNGATAYVAGDVVSYTDKLYEASTSTTGNLPTDTNYWVEISSTTITATVDLNSVVITTALTGTDVSILFRGRTGDSISYDTTSAFTYNALSLSSTGDSRKKPVLIITREDWSAIQYPDAPNTYSYFSIWANIYGGTDWIRIIQARLEYDQTKVGQQGFTNVTDFVNWLKANWVTTTTFTRIDGLTLAVYGTSIVVMGVDREGSALYNAGTTYQAGDVVKYNNALYRAKQTTTGNTPGANTAYWNRTYTFGLSSNNVGSKIKCFRSKDGETVVKDKFGTTERLVQASVTEADPARIFVTAAQFDSYIKGKFAALTLNGGTEEKIEYRDNSTIANLSFINCNILFIDIENTAVMIETLTTGSTAAITLKGGVYDIDSVFAYFSLSAAGREDESSIPESRVYTYTWVSNVANFEFESGPAEPSVAVDVFAGQKVALSNFEPIPNPSLYTYTARRIYRSVNGVYLFVAEIPATQTEYEDATAAEDLNEEMSVAGWKEPPATLQGLINLPNGIMAGFVGQDVYFCDPYHPHAWPESYVQTVDYSVVGLGRMDTTLVVLTKGTPYFIQGSHPDSMVVVKSDLQQSCASKRSIVSTNGMVIYASPDGLVMLSSGGSKLITENMFTRAQWQTYFLPETIHAYVHDMKYIAFYGSLDTVVDGQTIVNPRGGFIYDLTSGQLILHDIYATAGYTDLLRDELFLAFADRSLKKWLNGSAKNYTWRSKKFTLPQISGFSCAQVEAEGYPVTAKFYCDNSTTPIHTQTVTSRNVFRLPAKVGRDWEIQLEGNTEVFAVSIAQSPEELAGA